MVVQNLGEFGVVGGTRMNEKGVIPNGSASPQGGVANAPHAGFAVGVLTPPLTKGNSVPSGLPFF